MIKRSFDILISIFVICISWPIIIFIGILIRLNLGSPILFMQQRPGLNGVPFNMIKFRSMLDTTDRLGNDLPDVMRLTRFGKFLRSTSLDELPELLNVIVGDMSLVGPRPLLVEYLPLYSDYQARRHEVKPGITGWAQINGRNTLSWPDKFDLDVWYVDNQSLSLDLKIISLTVLKIFKREGVSALGEATMHAFIGNDASTNEKK